MELARYEIRVLERPRIPEWFYGLCKAVSTNLVVKPPIVGSIYRGNQEIPNNEVSTPQSLLALSSR
jgi:hypothetical protein